MQKCSLLRDHVGWLNTLSLEANHIVLRYFLSTKEMVGELAMVFAWPSLTTVTMPFKMVEANWGEANWGEPEDNSRICEVRTHANSVDNKCKQRELQGQPRSPHAHNKTLVIEIP